MTTSSRHVATEHGSRYLQQLCKHFAHRLSTEFDRSHGRIDFPLGRVDLTADATGLTIALEATDESRLAELDDVVMRHLKRFAFREPDVVGPEAPAD